MFNNRIFFCVPVILLIKIGSSNTSASGIHVINTVTTHVRIKSTFSGRRQIQVNCSNPNINQYTTPSTSAVLTTQSKSTLEPTILLTTQQVTTLVPTTWLNTQAISASKPLLTTQPTSTLDPTTRATGLSTDFIYLNNTCSVPFKDLPGWTVMQRRCSGAVDFHRTYADYEKGFGDRNGEIWIGNKWLYINTAASRLDLRVDFQASNGTQYYAIYSFQVGSPDTYYLLSVYRIAISDGIIDALEYHDNSGFSTFDADHDAAEPGNCADGLDITGGFWYKKCRSTSPNDKYYAYILWHVFDHLRFFQMSLNIS